MESTEAIIARVRQNPADAAWINELAKRSDPQVIPVLREVFVQTQLSGTTVTVGAFSARVAQITAAALIGLGVRDDRYFEELAKYVREAIAADPPNTYVLDDQRKEDTKTLNPAFVEWCNARSLEPTECMHKLLEYTIDLGYLGVQDARAISLLRKALNASNELIVSFAVASLARLNDTQSLSLIAQAVARFPPYASERIIVVYAEAFDDPAVLSLFDRFIQDPEKRVTVKKEWRAQHAKTEGPNERK